MNHRNPSVLETLLVKNVLAARDSPCINPLTYILVQAAAGQDGAEGDRDGHDRRAGRAGLRHALGRALPGIFCAAFSRYKEHDLSPKKHTS